MKFRTFFYVLFGFIGVGVIGYGLYENHAVLDAPFRLTANRTVPLFIVVISALVIGFLTALALGVVRVRVVVAVFPPACCA